MHDQRVAAAAGVGDVGRRCAATGVVSAVSDSQAVDSVHSQRVAVTDCAGDVDNWCATNEVVGVAIVIYVVSLVRGASYVGSRCSTTGVVGVAVVV